jgi:four helix bundle protein
MRLRSYHDLIAWQKAVDLVTEIYGVTRSFPKEEIYGLTSQLRRAAVSIPSNIAEGQGRLSTGEFKQFLGHARASLFEVETQLEIARRLEYLRADKTPQLLANCAELGRIINGLLASLEPESAKELAATTGH